MREMNEFLLIITGVLTVCLVGLFCAYWITRGKRLVYAGLAAMAVLACLGYAFLPASPEFTFHDVLFVSKIKHNLWWAVKDDGPFRFNACADFDNEKFIWAGYRARKLMYTELGTCKSIRKRGVWWYTDSEGNSVPASPEEMQEAEKQIAQYIQQTDGENEYARRSQRAARSSR